MRTDRPPLPGLRSQLVDAAARRAGSRARPRARRRPPTRHDRHDRPDLSRPRRRALPARVAFTAVLAAVVAMTSLSAPDAYADVEVTVANGFVTLLIVDVEASPEVIEDAARAADVRLRVELSPTGPSQQGRFVLASGSEIPDEVTTVGTTGSAFQGFSVPEGWAGELTLHLGADAHGEPYEVSSDAYAPGEPLHCSNLWARTVSAAADDLADLDLNLRFSALDGASPVVYDSPSDIASAHRSWHIVDAVATSAEDVLIYLNDEPTSPFPPARRSAGRFPKAC